MSEKSKIQLQGISIHAPREGGDGVADAGEPPGVIFQSTPPARGATGATQKGLTSAAISIHAPREGGDCLFVSLSRTLNHFNPRPPRGGRRCEIVSRLAVSEFQSTPPARGATTKGVADMACNLFQSTPPARGATTGFLQTCFCWRHFNPRPPRGGRLSLPTCKILATEFQSTPPARGATDRRSPYPGQCGISIHAPREGGDSCRPSFFNILAQISIHAPREGGDGKSGHGKTAGPKFQSTPPARGATLCSKRIPKGT